MDSKIKELFSEVNGLIKQLTEKLKPVAPNHWLCLAEWELEEIESEEFNLVYSTLNHIDYASLEHTDLTESGMKAYVDTEIRNIEARKARLADEDERARLKRKEMYEELKKEFG